MYTIKQAAVRTGLSIPTIRAWERRYGVISPERTPAGYRLYDEAAIERLAAMRALVEREGWRPSQAAERIRTPGLDLASLATQGRPVGGEADAGSGSSSATTSELAVPAFVAAARQLDVDRMERILDDAFAAQRFEHAMDDVVFPALRAVGRSWAEGDLDVGAEHAASETVRRRLARFFDAARRHGDRPRVLVGMPPGGQHELGVFAFAVACRRAGLEVLYLGSNVPLESWLRMARETDAAAVVLGAVTSVDSASVSLVVDAIQTIDHPPTSFAGGPAALDTRVVTGALDLPASLDDAVAIVRATVERAEGAPPVS